MDGLGAGREMEPGSRASPLAGMTAKESGRRRRTASRHRGFALGSVPKLGAGGSVESAAPPFSHWEMSS